MTTSTVSSSGESSGSEPIYTSDIKWGTMDVATALNIPEEEIVTFLEGKTEAEQVNWLQKAASLYNDPAFMDMMSNPKSRNVFLNEMGGDFTKLDQIQQSTDSIATSYSDTSSDGTTGGPSLPYLVSGSNFGEGSGIADQLRRFAENLANFMQKVSGMMTTQEVKGEVMYDPERLDKLDKDFDNYTALINKYSASDILFSNYKTDFNTDAAQFEAYLQARNTLKELDPSLTNDQIDAWAKASDGSILTGFDAPAITALMNTVIEDHEINKGTEGYSVTAALGTALANSIPPNAEMEAFGSKLDWANAQIQDIQGDMELLNQIKSDSGQLLTQYQEKKSAGGVTADDDEMRALRKSLCENILRYEGWSEEDIQSLSSDGTIPSNALLEACDKEGYFLYTDSNGNDNDHSEEEWEYNIEMITGVTKRFEDKTTEQLTNLQETMKFVDKIFDSAKARNDATSKAISSM